jgi:hypothetical protein
MLTAVGQVLGAVYKLRRGQYGPESLPATVMLTSGSSTAMGNQRKRNPSYGLRGLIEPSDAVNAGMAKQTGGRRRPELALWLFGWLDRPVTKAGQ